MYVKLYASILDSSIWDEPAATRLVWITLLCLADEEGFIKAVEGAIARRAAVTPQECAEALRVLQAPDPNSLDSDHEGRRLEKVDGGWLVLNYTRYREYRSREQVKSADRQRRKRDMSRSSRPVSRPSASASVVQDVLKEQELPETQEIQEIRGRDDDPAGFAACWDAYPKRGGSNNRRDALKAYVARLKAGATPDDLLAGTQRYAAYIRATGRERTEYVKQAATFYGPSEHFREAWDLPQAPAPPETERDRVRRLALEAHAKKHAHAHPTAAVA